MICEKELKNSNANNAIIENNGTLEIINGSIKANLGSGLINNNDGGVLKVGNGARIEASGQKQALYNLAGGTVEICEGAYLSSKAR